MPFFPPKIIYSRHYDISFFGLEKLHPFDSRKYGRVYRSLRKHLGPSLRAGLIQPRGPATLGQLQLVHTDSYLRQSLRCSKYLSSALEIPQLARAPAWLIDWRVLRPMRYAVAGTIL